MSECLWSQRGTKRRGKIRGAFFRDAQGFLWKAGCWLAGRLHQLKASFPMDLGISIFLIATV